MNEYIPYPVGLRPKILKNRLILQGEVSCSWYANAMLSDTSKIATEQVSKQVIK